MIAKLEAETTQFHARMTAAETQLTKWTSATVTGKRGTMMLQQGLQQLAFQATGVSGPVGKLSSGLLMIGAGGGAALAAAAAVGSLALAIRGLTADTRDTTRAQEEMLDSLGKLSQHGKIVAAQIRIDQINRELREPTLGEKLKIVGSAFIGPAFGGQSIFEHWEELKRERAQLLGVIGAAGGRVSQQESDLARRRADKAAEDARRRSLARVIPDTGQSARVMGEQLFQRDQAAMREKLFIDITRMEAGMFRFAKPPEVEPAEERFKFTPEFGVMSAAALLQGAQSGAAGLLGAAAGPVAMINPLAGAITAGIGGIFSLFDNSEERRHRALLDKLDKLGQEVGLDRVTIVFTGPDGHQIRKSLAELEEGDAVERVPGPVGAGG